MVVMMVVTVVVLGGENDLRFRNHSLTIPG